MSLPDTWLVFRLSALGDVVLTTGVLRWLHRRRGWRFLVLTREAYRPVFDNNPVVDSVICPPPGTDTAPGLLAWYTKLTGENRGLGLLDLHGNTRSRLLSAMWPGPVRRYPKHSLARRIFLASGGRMGGEALRANNVPQRYALAVESEAPPAQDLAPQLYLGPQEKRWANSFLASLNADNVSLSKDGMVAVHPYAAHPHKGWPEERVRQFLARLDGRGRPWVIVGAGNPMLPGDPRDLTGRTDLRQSAAILSRCEVLVTGDSGPMHLATSVGTPVVALFGPTTREWGFYPSGPHDRVLERNPACRPCSLHGKKACPRSGECLARISPEEVLEAVEATVALNAAQGRSSCLF